MSKIDNFFKLLKQALKGEQQDYTSGSMRRAVFLLSVPMILEMCLESVFAVVDIYFVNRLSEEAVSIVGLTEAMITIVYSVGIGLSAAATAMVARRIGEKNTDGAARAAINSLFVAGVVTIVLSLIGVIFAKELLGLMGAEPDAISKNIAYTQIMMGSCGVIILLFLINGIFRGAGDASIAMKSLWLANAFNILLCPLLIFGWGLVPALGIAGAALATAIGRGIGVLYQLFHLFKGEKGIIQIRRIHWNPDNAIIKSLVTLASPATFQFIIQSASWIFLAGIVARGGSEASAGYQTAIRLVVFFILPAWGLSNAAATLVGQNLGAGKPDRAEASVITIAKFNAIFMGGVMLFFLILAEPLIAFFIPDASSGSFPIAVQALQVISTGYIFYGIGMVLMQAFNGAGDTKTPTWISFFGFWIFQVPFAAFLFFILDWGPFGAFIAIPIAESLIALVYWYFFRKGKWKQAVV
ncbi:MAG: MATE family efflux transporter [Flavobacteriales bacterium]|nr:MATE family efflux transporter [Flavobacteriales bacterium]